jgi:predicted ATPase
VISSLLVCEDSRPSLTAWTALEQLVEADILLVQGVSPGSDYRFKHALIQDAAYQNLLKSRRQVLHRRIAEILRDRFPDTAAAEPEVLAHHFTQAGLTDEAIEWWGKAGDHALRRSAFQEAISHLGKAIEMADKALEGTSAAVTASRSQRLKIQTDLGKALMWSRGFATEESKAAFMRARELAAAIEDATPTYKGRELPRAPRTDPYVHLYAYGSYLGCLTANRWFGQGWRIRGCGSQSSASFVIRVQLKSPF